MSNYSVLKQDINNNIYENQTQQITGTVLNAILNEMTASLGAGYQFAGVATRGMYPGDPDQRVFYLAGEGVYTNFGGIQVPAGKLGVLKWDNRWTLQTIDGLGGGGANLTGYVSVASTDDLPDEGVATLGYLCGTNLYLYVGEGGDTKEGKYQDCGSFRGPEGAYIQDIEQTETSHENGGRNTIKMTLSDGRSFNAYVHNGTTSSGLFPTVAALQAAYPSPVVGQYAFVGAGFPADIYVCTTAGTWTDSGEDYDGDNVDLTDYATKAEVNQLEAEVDDGFYGEYVTIDGMQFAEKTANKVIGQTGNPQTNYDYDYFTIPNNGYKHISGYASSYTGFPIVAFYSGAVSSGNYMSSDSILATVAYTGESYTIDIPAGCVNIVLVQCKSSGHTIPDTTAQISARDAENGLINSVNKLKNDVNSLNSKDATLEELIKCVRLYSRALNIQFVSWSNVPFSIVGNVLTFNAECYLIGYNSLNGYARVEPNTVIDFSSILVNQYRVAYITLPPTFWEGGVISIGSSDIKYLSFNSSQGLPENAVVLATCTTGTGILTPILQTLGFNTLLQKGASYKLVACVIRNINGTWQQIGGTHKSLNVASISQTENYIQVNFDFTAKNVVSINVTPDEDFAALGYTIGASVGLQNANIYLFNKRPICGVIYYYNGQFVSSNPDFVIGGFDGGVLTITHPKADNNYVNISPDGRKTIQYGVVAESQTTTKVYIRDWSGNLINTPSANIQFYLERRRDTVGLPVADADQNGNIWVFGIMEV